jgi:hypothetical protein
LTFVIQKPLSFSSLCPSATFVIQQPWVAFTIQQPSSVGSLRHSTTLIFL